MDKKSFTTQSVVIITILMLIVTGCSLENKTETKNDFQPITVILVDAKGQETLVDTINETGIMIYDESLVIDVDAVDDVFSPDKINWGTDASLEEAQDNSQKYQLQYNGKQIVLQIVEEHANVNGKLDKAMLPIANIAETLGYSFEWNPDTYELRLTEPTTFAQVNEDADIVGNIKPVTPMAEGLPENYPVLTRNNSNLTTISGQKLPMPDRTQDWDEIRGEVYDKAWEKGEETKFLKGVENHRSYRPEYHEEDHIIEGQYKRIFVGTVYEVVVHNMEHLTEAPPANPDFVIWGENSNDTRIGTALITPGSNAWLDVCKYMEEEPETYTTTSIAFIEGTFRTDFMTEDRRLSQDKVNDFAINSSLTLSQHAQGGLEHFLDGDKLEDLPWYDATGVFDGFSEMSNGKIMQSIGSLKTLYLMKSGKVYMEHDLRNNTMGLPRNEVVDKIIHLDESRTTGLKTAYVVDVPDLQFNCPEEYGIGVILY